MGPQAQACRSQPVLTLCASPAGGDVGRDARPDPSRLNPGWILLGVGLSHCFHDKNLGNTKHPFSDTILLRACLHGVCAQPPQACLTLCDPASDAPKWSPSWASSAGAINPSPQFHQLQEPQQLCPLPHLHLPMGHPGRPHTRREGTRPQASGRKDQATCSLASSTRTLPPSSN